MVERFKQLIEFYGLTPYSLEQKISVSDGTISKFLVGKIGLKVSTILKILGNFPDISPDWLLLGKGEMLRKNVPDGALSQPQSSDFVQKILADKDRRIEDLVRENERLRIEADGLREKLNSVLAPIHKESSSL